MLTSHSVACWVQKGLIVSWKEDTQTLEEAINALTEAMNAFFLCCFFKRGFGKMESHIRVFPKKSSVGFGIEPRDVSLDENIDASRSSELGEFLLLVEPSKTHEQSWDR